MYKIKKNLGYSFIELLLILAIVIITLTGIYVFYNKKRDATLMNQQISYLEILENRLNDYLIAVGNNGGNPISNYNIQTELTNALEPSKLLENKLVPEQMINRNQQKLETLFGTQINITPTQPLTNPELSLDIELTNLNKNQCIFFLSDKYVRNRNSVKVNGVELRNPSLSMLLGGIRVEDTINACSNAQNNIKYTFNLTKLGNYTYEQNYFCNNNPNLCQLGRIRKKEEEQKILPMAAGVNSPVMTCPGDSVWNDVAKVCTCGENKVWNGYKCFLVDTVPGYCNFGYGWDFNDNTCKIIRDLPDIPATLVPRNLVSTTDPYDRPGIAGGKELLPGDSNSSYNYSGAKNPDLFDSLNFQVGQYNTNTETYIQGQLQTSPGKYLNPQAGHELIDASIGLNYTNQNLEYAIPDPACEDYSTNPWRVPMAIQPTNIGYNPIEVHNGKYCNYCVYGRWDNTQKRCVAPTFSPETNTDEGCYTSDHIYDVTINKCRCPSGLIQDTTTKECVNDPNATPNLP